VGAGRATARHTVDWPACAFWRELADANPDAIVLLSTRGSAEEWWRSAERTIFEVLGSPVDPADTDRAARRAMTLGLIETRLTRDWRDGEAAIAAYERHNAEVRNACDDGRLVEWQPGDGWAPICEALSLPVPERPFPHANPAGEFRAREPGSR